MDSNTLRKLQEPLKAKYKTNPEAALITLRATARMSDGISCKIETGKALVEAGLHPSTGGDGTLACSGDMLLEALAACAGVTLKAVATSIEFNLEDVSIFAEGDLDFRGTLAVDKTASVGFQEIRLRFQLKTNESDEKISTLLKLTERYCVVFQTLAKGNSIKLTVAKY